MGAGADERRPASGLAILKRRADFLAAARGYRSSTPAFTLQARRRAPQEAPGPLRVGFTCSKKVGNSVARNRAKRRLRAAARQVLPHSGRPDWDYVLIGREGETARRDFATTCEDLRGALAAVHGRDPTP